MAKELYVVVANLSVAGGLTAVDVQNFAGDKRRVLQVANPVDNVGDGAHPPQRVHRGESLRVVVGMQ